MSMLDSPTVALPIVTPKPPKRSSRKRTVAILVALLVGLPAIALAATYLFGQITGTAKVNQSDAAVTITNVTGTGLTGPGAGGIDCLSSGWTPGSGQQAVNIVARAFRVIVNGTPPADNLPLGTCTVTMVVNNTGVAPATVHADFQPLAGWTFDATPAVSLPAGGNATITVHISAMGNAVGATENGGNGVPILGTLNVDIPPLGAGQ